MPPPAAGTAPPPLPRWWPPAPRLPVVKLESLKRWNEERGLWCEKGVQVLLTTVGAFAAFGLMTIAISTDYWLYTRAFICNTTNLTAGDDGPPPRAGSSEKKDPGGLTHSGLWRICCLEGRASLRRGPVASRGLGLPAARAPPPLHPAAHPSLPSGPQPCPPFVHVGSPAPSPLTVTRTPSTPSSPTVPSPPLCPHPGLLPRPAPLAHLLPPLVSLGLSPQTPALSGHRSGPSPLPPALLLHGAACPAGCTH